MGNHITSLEQLEALYGPVAKASLDKETPKLTPSYRCWLEQSSFFAFASVGEGRLDCSPRGDARGQLIKILSDSQLAIPDRRGNNRIDTLKNLVVDPRVALLFFIPGIEETLRIRGKATISTESALLAQFEVDGKLPLSVILVDIEAVYFQCARALKRSRLWDPEVQLEKTEIPSAGQMIKGAAEDFDAEAYDKILPERQKATLY